MLLHPTVRQAFLPPFVILSSFFSSPFLFPFLDPPISPLLSKGQSSSAAVEAGGGAGRDLQKARLLLFQIIHVPVYKDRVWGKLDST